MGGCMVGGGVGDVNIGAVLLLIWSNLFLLKVISLRQH